MHDYINGNSIVKDEIYKNFESSITCIICLDIIIEPTMCMKCKNVYCKQCIKDWSKHNTKCPNRCENPEYQNCKDLSQLLSKLNFNCKKCNNIINYNEMEKHYLSKCILGNVQNNSDNYEKALNERNYSFQKLNYSDKNKEPTMSLTSKLIYIFIIILFFSYNSGNYCCWENIFNTKVRNNSNKFN